MMRAVALFIAVFLVGACDAFNPSSTTTTTAVRSSLTCLSAAVTAKTRPKLNKATGEWEKAEGDDGEYPYGAFGTLLRHGPSPFVSRVTNPAQYEQFVLSYMDGANVDRAEATGNIDAKMNNELDWMYQKIEEKKGRPKVDYTALKKKDAFLTITWAVFILPTVYYVVDKTISEVMSH